jgi:uncharacterized protein with HEPN domain/predicted nucleotidyltransferase
MIELIDSKRAELEALCAKYRVQRLQPFGSVVSGQFDPATSDLDFLVEFQPASAISMDRFFGLKEDLEHLFGRSVDLVDPDKVRNPYFLRAIHDPQAVTMNDRVRKLLHDMSVGCADIEQFAAGKSFADYAADKLLRLAVERELEIIGEALNQLLKLEPALETAITAARRIVDLRNLLIHAYATIDNEMIWKIVQENAPVLRAEVDKLLQAPEPPRPE